MKYVNITNIITGILECVLWFLRFKRRESQNEEKNGENEKKENQDPKGDE